MLSQLTGLVTIVRWTIIPSPIRILHDSGLHRCCTTTTIAHVQDIWTIANFEYSRNFLSSLRKGISLPCRDNLSGGPGSEAGTHPLPIAGEEVPKSIPETILAYFVGPAYNMRRIGLRAIVAANISLSWNRSIHRPRISYSQFSSKFFDLL